MTADEIRRYLWRVRPEGVNNPEGVVKSVLSQPEGMQQLWLDTMLEGARKWEGGFLASIKKAASELGRVDGRYCWDDQLKGKER